MDTPDKEAVSSELDSFRRQWISDLQSRKEKEKPTVSPAEPPRPSQSVSRLAKKPPVRKTPAPTDDDDDDAAAAPCSADPPHPSPSKRHDEAPPKQLVSALDHYEEAMEKEAQGDMGESVRLYRKAYRLDARVDKAYRERHPPPKPAPQPVESRKQEESQPLSMEDLLASFSCLTIQPAPPVIEGDIPPPCPISRLPDELVVHILQDVAGEDVGDFSRCALVCKRLAYLVATEERIWKAVCLGGTFGFPGMRRRFTLGIAWEPPPAPPPLTLTSESELDDDDDGKGEDEGGLKSGYPSWRSMFRSRPRIRFNGCYISTVNYVRSGQLSTNQVTWGGAPVLIVTYYRYLRFYRDGAAISLLTTVAPADVVHSLTRENLATHKDEAHSFMQHAYRGRWRLSSDGDETGLYVETEGVGGKYEYRMDLCLQSAGKATAARNTKIAWKGYYCHKLLTDDWAEFHLKNDKPFFFSRVKSYPLHDD